MSRIRRIQDLTDLERLLVANRELEMRLDCAQDVIKRGISVICRKPWESGETDNEWTMAAEQWLAARRLENEIEGLFKENKLA
jgi:hypothetical protein